MMASWLLMPWSQAKIKLSAMFRHIICTPFGHIVADWVAAVAESLIGTLSGAGRDSIGIDCSALVQLSLAAGGIRAMRNSGDQEKTLGQTIDRQAGGLSVVIWSSGRVISAS